MLNELEKECLKLYPSKFPIIETSNIFWDILIKRRIPYPKC